MKKVIGLCEYDSAMFLLNLKLAEHRNEFDCIVCLKRSGFILGAYLSNKLNLPLFTASEINSIPKLFTNVLIVDDKICTGKSIKKVERKLINANKKCQSACLFIESTFLSTFYIAEIKEIVKMWYEV